MSQLVGRFDTRALDDAQREAAVEWVRSLGLDANELCPTIAICRDENGYELHVSRAVGDEPAPGEIKAPRLDVARNDIVTEPVVVPLGADATWPELGRDIAEVPA